MKRVDIASAKLNVVFREGELPAIDPADPSFVLVLARVYHVRFDKKAIDVQWPCCKSRRVLELCRTAPFAKPL